MQGEGALAIGTQVSAKYKGAFCEAKVRSVDKQVKCRVTFKFGLGSTTISDKDIKTDKPLVQGASVLAKHPDKQEYCEAIVKEIKDQSRYTVTFNDGDIATLRRNALCMKSGKHYNASESLDNLPLTHPEHFSTPVSGSRRRSGRSGPGGMGTPGSSTGGGPDSDDYDSSSDGEEISSSYLTNIGRVVWAENTDKKSKGWFPALIVAPSASDTVKIDTKEEFLIRSFKDGRYYTVSKKDTNRFHKEAAKRSDKEHLRDVIEKAVAYLERDELPPHWDKEILFNMGEESTTESSESEEIDDEEDAESPEEKDHLVAELYKHMEDRGAPINRTPMIDGREVDLYRLFRIVYKLGGQSRVTNKNMWQQVAKKLGFETAWCINQVRVHYKRYLQSFEQLNRTLGCTMRNRQSQQTSGGRAQIRGLHRSGGSKEALSPATSSLGTSGSICGDLPESEKTEEKQDSTNVLTSSVASSTTLVSQPSPIITLTSTLTPAASITETPARIKTETQTSAKPKSSELSLKSRMEAALTPKAKSEASSAIKSKLEASVKSKIEAATIPKSKPDVAKSAKSEANVIAKAVEVSSSKSKQDSVTKSNKNNIKTKSDSAKSKPEKEKKEKNPEKTKETVPVPTKVEPEDSPSKAREGRKGKADKAAAIAAASTKDKHPSNRKKSESNDVAEQPTPKTPTQKKRMNAIASASPVAAATPKEASSSSSSSSSSEKESKMTTRPRRDSTSSLAAAMQNKEKKDTIGESTTKRPFVRVDRDRDVEKEARKLQNSKTATTPAATVSTSLPPMSPGTAPPLVPAPPSSKGDRDSSNERDSSVDAKRDSSRGRKKSGNGKIRQKIAKRDPAEDESMNGEEKQHLAPNVDVAVGDKIKVHYKRDTIYDAKVTKVQHDEGEKWPKYYVHYQGWNARYDEWIKRSRIADNLSWNKERAKKGGNSLTSSTSSVTSDASVTEQTAAVSENQEIPAAQDSIKSKDSSATPAKALKKERSVSRQKGKPGATSATPTVKTEAPANNSRSATPSSITSKESRTGSPVLKRQTSRTSIKKETDSDDDDDEEEESETVAEPRKSTRLQKTPTSEKKKTQGGRKPRPPTTLSKTESSETEVEVEHEDIKEEPEAVVAEPALAAALPTVETPVKDTPTKGKRGRKAAVVAPVTTTNKTDAEDEKTVEVAPNKPETPRASRGTPTRERAPNAKVNTTPKGGRKIRGSSVGRDEDDDPYDFKEPEPFGEVKFETPRKSPGKKSAAQKEVEKSSTLKKSARSVKPAESEESADSSSDEAGKKLTAAAAVTNSRGRSRKNLALATASESNSSDAEPIKILPAEDVEMASADEKKPVLPVSAPTLVDLPVVPSPPTVEPIVDKVLEKIETTTIVVPTPQEPVKALQPPPVVSEKSKVEKVKEEPVIVTKISEPKVDSAVADSNVPHAEQQTIVDRPVLQLSKKQQELFPHLAAIRTTSIPFSRGGAAATAQPAKLSVVAARAKSPAASKAHQSIEPVVAEKAELKEEQPTVKEAVSATPSRDESVKSPTPKASATSEEKSSKSRSTSAPPPSASSSSPASATSSIASSKKQRKTPKKPNSSELVESDSDSGNEFDKKSSKSSKSESIKSKPAKGGRHWNSTGNKRKEPPGGDSGEDEPLGLRVINANKKLATVSASGEKPEWKRNSKQTASASTTATTTPISATKKEDADDLDLVCAETIPGSPVHPSSGGGNAASALTPNVGGNSADLTEDALTGATSRLEMPFASVPESVAAAETSATKINSTSPPHSVSHTLPSSSLPVPAAAAAAKEDTTDEEEGVTATTTTTTTNTSSASQSPREEAVERSKSPAESSEVDLDSLSGQNKSESLDVETETKRSNAVVAGTKRKAPPSDVGSRSPVQNVKRKRRVREVAVGRGARGGRGRHGSDRLVKADDEFDDCEETSHHTKNVANISSLGALDNDALNALAQRSPSSKKYNFFVDLDPAMDSSERISRIQNSLKELRKTYHSVKSELAVIERRRKKIRRKERERAEKGMPGNPVEAAA